MASNELSALMRNNLILVSVRWPLPNLLILNFPCHSAHHEQLAVPWHGLPALHRELYGNGSGQVIPMSRLLPFHRHRVKRALSDDFGVVGTGGGLVSFPAAV